jgi:hypothetical protein
VIRILADENFHGAIMRGLLRRIPELDVVRVQDIGLEGREDLEILAIAAEQDRVLLTHDVKTITRFAYERLAAGLPLPGILEVPQDMNIGQAVEEILLMAEYMPPEEWQDRIYYLPL